MGHIGNKKGWKYKICIILHCSTKLLYLIRWMLLQTSSLVGHWIINTFETVIITSYLVHFLVTFSFLNSSNFLTFTSLDSSLSKSRPKLHRLSKLKCLLTVSSSIISTREVFPSTWLILWFFFTCSFIPPTVWVLWPHSSQETEGFRISEFP